MQISKKRLATSLLAAAGLTLLLAGCTPKIEHRGYMPKPGAFDQITAGMTKMEVEGIMGTPSTTASVQYKGDSYYYITSITQSKAFLKDETDRSVIAIRFNESGQVKSFAQYGLQDGRVIDVNLFGAINNLFDTRYADSGQLSGGTTPTPLLSPGLPRAFYAGIEVSL